MSFSQTTCLNDERFLPPITIMCLGAGIHFLICFAIFWRFTDETDPYLQEMEDSEHPDKVVFDSKMAGRIIFVVKCLIVFCVTVCAIIQMVLDYLKSAEYGFGGSWGAYTCAVFLFSNSPNLLHGIAAFFAMFGTVMLRRFDKSNRLILIFMVIAEIGVNLVTPFTAGFFTHLTPGFFTYIWIGLPILLFSLGLAWKGNQMSEEFSQLHIVLFVVVGVALMCGVLFVVIIINTQIKLYAGTEYMKSIELTLTERKVAAWTQQALTDFDRRFTFYWLIL